MCLCLQSRSVHLFFPFHLFKILTIFQMTHFRVYVFLLFSKWTNLSPISVNLIFYAPAVCVWPCPCPVLLEEWIPSIKFQPFISFQVTHVFQGELHKMKIVYSKCYKVLTELCLHIFWPGVPPLLLVTKFRNCLLVFIFDDKPISTLFPKNGHNPIYSLS